MTQPTTRATRDDVNASETGRDDVVEIDDFSFWYGDTRALNDIHLAIARHRITAFIGPSGCGKSTLLRSVNRLNDLIVGTRHDGEIRIDEKNVYHRSVDVVELRRRVGMVFQHPNPFPKTIFDNVAYGPRLNGLCPPSELSDRVEDALKKAALWDEVKDRLDALGTSLSGGQQQRLCIARALANESDIILLDEPCSALDPIATQRIEELLVQLKTDYTVVIVTHNLQQASRIADITAFFYLGELIEVNESTVLFTRPEHERTEAYVTGRFG